MEQNVIVDESSSDLRTLARQALSGNWSTAVLGTIIQMVIVALPVFVVTVFFKSQFTEGIVNLYSFLISGAIALGYAMFTIRIFRGEQTTPFEIFSGFEYYGKALGVYAMIAILAFIQFIPFFAFLLLKLAIPGLTIGIFLFIFAGIAFIWGLAMAIVIQYRYAMAYYILADNLDKGVMACIRESRRIMHGNKWNLFCLEISFIGWILLAILTFGIGILWLNPYINVSTVAFYEIARGHLKIQRISSNSDFNRNDFAQNNVSSEANLGVDADQKTSDSKSENGIKDENINSNEHEKENEKEEDERKNPFELK
ncbi:DUF975 family protein [Sinanaerobacter sp. ZZT-01]|uniref:DUF975 family protein n=1 Tax=Sinanaerobacter sp. ZZT-01 TaxID=3111540 RepID=UPI002D78BDA4|nr:DUF975 family protein [Sinanaerobacter sp. ZZT-01]WRR93410.1 DUF975 family protein [Sinanaerobacter sp. ZZT-01]